MNGYIEISKIKKAYNLGIDDCNFLMSLNNVHNRVLTKEEIGHKELYATANSMAEQKIADFMREASVNEDKENAQKLLDAMTGIFVHGYYNFGNEEIAKSTFTLFQKILLQEHNSIKAQKLLAKAIHLCLICTSELPKEQAVLYLHNKGYKQFNEEVGLSFEYVKSIIATHTTKNNALSKSKNISTPKEKELRKKRIKEAVHQYLAGNPYDIFPKNEPVQATIKPILEKENMWNDKEFKAVMRDERKKNPDKKNKGGRPKKTT